MIRRLAPCCCAGLGPCGDSHSGRGRLSAVRLLACPAVAGRREASAQRLKGPVPLSVSRPARTTRRLTSQVWMLHLETWLAGVRAIRLLPSHSRGSDPHPGAKPTSRRPDRNRRNLHRNPGPDSKRLRILLQEWRRAGVVSYCSFLDESCSLPTAMPRSTGCCGSSIHTRRHTAEVEEVSITEAGG